MRSMEELRDAARDAQALLESALVRGEHFTSELAQRLKRNRDKAVAVYTKRKRAAYLKNLGLL